MKKPSAFSTRQPSAHCHSLPLPLPMPLPLPLPLPLLRRQQYTTTTTTTITTTTTTTTATATATTATATNCYCCYCYCYCYCYKHLGWQRQGAYPGRPALACLLLRLLLRSTSRDLERITNFRLWLMRMDLRFLICVIGWVLICRRTNINAVWTVGSRLTTRSLLKAPHCMHESCLPGELRGHSFMINCVRPCCRLHGPREDTLCTWITSGIGKDSGVRTHTLDVSCRLPDAHVLRRMNTPFTNGASCTTPAGSLTYGLTASHTLLTFHKQLTFIVWTSARHLRMPQLPLCIGKTGRWWRRGRPVYRHGSGRRRRRHNVLHLSDSTRKWCRALRQYLLMRCSSHLYSACADRHVVDCLLECFLQIVSTYDNWRKAWAQTYGADSTPTKVLRHLLMSATDERRSRPVDSSDIEFDSEASEGEHATPNDTPLPRGPPPPHAVQAERPMSFAISSAIAATLASRGIHVRQVLTMVTGSLASMRGVRVDITELQDRLAHDHPNTLLFTDLEDPDDPMTMPNGEQSDEAGLGDQAADRALRDWNEARLTGNIAEAMNREGRTSMTREEASTLTAAMLGDDIDTLAEEVTAAASSTETPHATAIAPHTPPNFTDRNRGGATAKPKTNRKVCASIVHGSCAFGSQSAPIFVD